MLPLSLPLLAALLPMSAAQNTTTGTMPDEGDTHLRTWMAFAFNETVWDDLLETTQQNLADVAVAISAFEPVVMLVRPQERDILAGLLNNTSNITMVEAAFDDLWTRDTGPVFVRTGGAESSDVAGVDFNFNGWGNKQGHANDSKVAAEICAAAGVPRITTSLVLEGGALEVDGEGTAIITESCVLNPNRNPGWTKEQVEAELGRLLGIEKIIWLPGIIGKDITDAHTDFYSRFIRPGVVVAAYDPDPLSYDHNVTTSHLDILATATDAKGRSLNVTVLDAPDTSKLRKDFRNDPDFAAGYINFYTVNGGVILPQFGDSAADAAALQKVQALYPDRRVVQVNIDGIAAGGGGIHCSTQQEILHAAGPLNASVVTGTGTGTGTASATPGASSSAGHSSGRRRAKWSRRAMGMLGLGVLMGL